jgi:hypothetical protein
MACNLAHAFTNYFVLNGIELISMPYTIWHWQTNMLALRDGYQSLNSNQKSCWQTFLFLWV